MTEHRTKVTQHRIKVDEYEFVTLAPRCSWIAVWNGGKLVSSGSDRDEAVVRMLEQLDAARVVVQAARAAVEAPTLLQEALALHDRLTSDREPPSAWCGAVPMVKTHVEAFRNEFAPMHCLHPKTARGKDVPLHPKTARGKDVPRMWGSWRTQVCLDCGVFRMHSHNEEPSMANHWRPAHEYGETTAGLEDD